MSLPSHAFVPSPLLAALITFVVLAVVVFPGWSAEGTAPLKDVSRRAAQRLSMEPEIDIRQGVCYVRGAVWIEGKGPKTNEEVALVDRAKQIHAIGLTDRHGFYEVEIVLIGGKGLILKEQDYEQESRRFRKWIGGADVICAKATVEVGEIQKIVSSVMDRPQ